MELLFIIIPFFLVQTGLCLFCFFVQTNHHFGTFGDNARAIRNESIDSTNPYMKIL
jgi:hypothetical protein